MTLHLEGLPPEMQDRIRDIVAKAKSASPPHPDYFEEEELDPDYPQQRDLTLEEQVLDLRRQIYAQSQVIDAVGQAVGQMYQMMVQEYS